MKLTVLSWQGYHMITSMLDVVTYDDFLNFIDDITGHVHEYIEIVNVEYRENGIQVVVEVRVTPKVNLNNRYEQRYVITKTEIKTGRAFTLPRV